jgi:hypothetical protein
MYNIIDKQIGSSRVNYIKKQKVDFIPPF